MKHRPSSIEQAVVSPIPSSRRQSNCLELEAVSYFRGPTIYWIVGPGLEGQMGSIVVVVIDLAFLAWAFRSRPNGHRPSPFTESPLPLPLVAGLPVTEQVHLKDQAARRIDKKIE